MWLVGVKRHIVPCSGMKLHAGCSKAESPPFVQHRHLTLSILSATSYFSALLVIRSGSKDRGACIQVSLVLLNSGKSTVRYFGTQRLHSQNFYYRTAAIITTLLLVIFISYRA